MIDLFARRGAYAPIADFIDADGDCWEWLGRLDRDGYGTRGRYQAHRLIWEALVGPIPDGLQLDHLCRNRRCVNPDHLEPVTAAVNIRRTPPGRKGKHHHQVRGSDHPNSQKTHCKRGHEFTPENTMLVSGWKGRGARRCRTCSNQASNDGHKRARRDPLTPRR